MIAVDSNVLLRVITNDDPHQARRAAALLRGTSPIFIAKTVLLEIEWVLRKTYRLERAQMLATFHQLLKTANFHFEDQPAIANAMDWYSSGMDFADALHVASSGPQKRFATFDRDLRRRLTRIASVTPADF